MLIDSARHSTKPVILTRKSKPQIFCHQSQDASRSRSSLRILTQLRNHDLEKSNSYAYGVNSAADGGWPLQRPFSYNFLITELF